MPRPKKVKDVKPEPKKRERKSKEEVEVKKRGRKSKEENVDVSEIGAVEVFKTKSLVQKLENLDDMFIFVCPGKYRRKMCGNSHFRHAGYMQFLVPWMKPSGERKISNDSVQVMVCTRCKSAYVYMNDVFYDVTDKIDLKAWEKSEKQLQKATGPGGEC